MAAETRLCQTIAGATGWPVVSTCCADMQIDGGRCVLGAADAAAWEAMDRAGRFTAVQLGEWGYYFHRLIGGEDYINA